MDKFPSHRVSYNYIDAIRVFGEEKISSLISERLLLQRNQMVMEVNRLFSM